VFPHLSFFLTVAPHRTAVIAIIIVIGVGRRWYRLFFSRWAPYRAIRRRLRHRHLCTLLSILLFTAHALSLSYHGHLSPENGGCPCGDGKRAAVVDCRAEREQLAGVCRLVGRWSEVL